MVIFGGGPLWGAQKNSGVLPLHTERLNICLWNPRDLPYAKQLWGDPAVMGSIDGRDGLSDAEVQDTLHQQILSQHHHHVSLWKLIHRSTMEFIGCAGLRPTSGGELEIVVDILSKRWGSGYAAEAGSAVLNYAFGYLEQSRVWASHYPENLAPAHLLLKVGFVAVGERYELTAERWAAFND